MKHFTIILLMALLFTGIYNATNFIKEWHAGYELQQINMLEVERCTEAMRMNPGLICD